MTATTRRKSGNPNEHSHQAKFVMAALEKYEQPLTRYAMRLMSGDLSTARDVVQHTFLKLCESDYRAIEKRLAPWLYTVCRNRAIDMIRGRSNEEQLDLVETIQPHRNGTARTSNPATIVEETDFFEQLRSLISELPDSQREVIELWSQGINSNEIGEIIGKKSGAVRISLHRAVKQLKTHEAVKRWLTDDDAHSENDKRLTISLLNNPVK